MENICRICMNSSVNLMNIFKHIQLQKNEPSIAEMITECANCELRPDDELPKGICITCILDSQAAFRFKRRCERSYQLLSYVNSTNHDEGQITVKSMEKHKESEKEDHQCVLEAAAQADDVNIPVQGRSPAEEVESTSNPVQSVPDQCEICKNTFKTKAEMEVHQCSLTKQYTFHKVSHMDDRPYQCPHCYQRFSRLKAVRAHIRIHTGERPYQCPDCHQRFKRSSDLRIHIRIHTGERPYKCPQCLKAFKQISHMREHARLHGRIGKK